MATRRRLYRVAAVLSAIALAFCTGDSPGPVGPERIDPPNAATVAATGTIRARTSTTGVELDPNGYTVAVDTGGTKVGPQAIGDTGTVRFTNVVAGTRTVTLSGIASNCTTKNNPRTVSLTAGTTVTVTFNVTCVATTGSLTVGNTTSGAELDPDGYTATVDTNTATAKAVPVNGSVTFTGLSAGSHTVTLSGIAANCTAATNPQTATVTAGATTTTNFAVTCVTTHGNLTVTTATTGVELDPDGYTVAVDSGAAQAIGVNGSLTIANLTAGSHTVTLAGIATNCTAAANPQMVTVVAGTTTTLPFTLTCAATTGTVAATTTTTGVELDPDGYTVSLDGGAGQAIGVNGSVSFATVAPGSHTVALSGLASNCTVSGANPQTVTVTAGATTSAGFNVTCVTTHGDLTVTTATTGSDLDPDGYTASVDGGAGQAVGINASVTFTNLTQGSHTVTLSGLAANCSAATNPQTVTVVAGTTTTASFAITCAAIVTTGSLAVATTTTGADLDPDGYTLTVDGNAAGAQPVGSNGAFTFTGLAAGSHSVALSGIAANCTAASNPQTATVVAGSTTNLSFTITCVTTHGDLTVTTATSGVELDPDGYAASVDGGSAQPIAINGTLTFSALTAGSHTVTLSGLAPNCSAAANPQTVTVVAGSSTTLAFSVTCAATTGNLTVTSATTGADLDPDGYSVSVDGGAGQSIGINASLTIAKLAPGSHTVTLSGVAGNCTVTSANPQTVSVTAGATTTASFAVSCAAIVTSGNLAVTTTTTGADLDPDGYTLTVDGNTVGAQAIADNGTVTFTALAAGSHTVALSGLSPNCSAAANPQTANVVAGSTTNLSFAISCVTTHGNLTVTTATTGADLDPDGYTVSVDGGAAQAIAINGSATFTALLQGSHTVTLAGLAPNCSAAANPQTVNVVAGGTTSLAFTLTCVTTHGDLTVTTATTGVELDPDGYSVSVDGGVAQPIGINASLGFASLAAGSHTVTLGGLAANCSAASNPQNVTVVAGTTATLGFAITCVTTKGSISVSATTTGADLDPDGYSVAIAGPASATQALAINGSTTFPNLATGSYTVTLSGIAANCTVSGANPQTVSVAAGATTSLGFSVSCVTTHGDLTVTTATTGVELDPDGYTASIDGGAPQAIAINGSLTVSALPAGSHTVTLSGLAPNCSAAANPQTVNVVAGTTTSLAFTLTCVTTHGDLAVTTATTGADLDPDGYTISLDGGAAQAIGVNASFTFAALAAGSHTVTLAGLAPNCSATTTSQTVTVVAGTTTTAAFSVSCVTTHGNLTVTTSTTGSDLDPDGYSITVSSDAPLTQSVATNGSVTFTALSAGSHTVTLSGVAGNCSVTSANPQTVSVTAGATTTATFAINCAPIVTSGNLAVTTTTTGADLDPDGYTLTVDGNAAGAQAIADNGSFSFTSLAAGSHTVALSGLSSNCSTTNNPQTVTIVAGSTTNASFAVTCVTTHGNLTVTTATTGADLDPDGYSVSVDGGTAQPISINGSVTFMALSQGSHSVTLSGLATNCSAATNPQTVTVVAGTTTNLGFAITCASTHADLTVTATTTGVELDPDGYTVSVDGGASQPLTVNGSTTFTALAAGSHTVTLAGIASNCSAANNPQTVTTVGGTPATVGFTVSCVTTHGDLAVTTTTTGADLDPDGYTLTVDGNTAGAQAIADNGSFTFTGLAAGSHSVALSGVAPNCTAAANPQTATVVAGSSTTVSFAISCVTTHGNLTVTTATTGAELDPDGYAVSVDGGTAQPITINGSVTFAALLQGSHTLTLSGVAANCAVSGANPQTVTITAGTANSASFAITCSATTGSLAVTTTTTGADLDPDGYSATVDGNATSAQPVGVNGTVTFTGLAAGTHTVSLSGLAANCSAATNPQSITVVAGGTATLTFAVTCVTTHGNLTVTTTTTGAELDPDGYTASVDGGAGQAIATNGTLAFSALTAGAHTVTLAGLAPNCSAATNPQTATVVAGSTTTLAFTLTCVATTGNLTTTTTTTGADLDPDGYTVTLDGNSATAQPIGINGTVNFTTLTAGSHSVALSGLAPNCGAAANPQSVNIVAGTTTTLGFTITCVTTHGDLTVTNTTGGVELDPDGYTVTVDGDATTARALAVNGSVTYTGLAAGSHSLALSGLAPNCTAASNPMTVTVVAGTSTGLAFSITCVTTKGTISFTAATLGLDLDPDGYTAILDSATSQSVSSPVATNGSTSFANVSAGAHVMTIAGVATNCSLGNTSQTVNVTAGATTPVTFNVFCIAQHASTYTFVGAGDIADCTRVDDDSTASVLKRIVAANPGAVVYTIGDNVYDAATASDYANCYDPTWGQQKSRTFATLGNHDYKLDPNPSWDYFGTRAGPRGLGYYSYNLGDYWHIIVLNDNASYGGPLRTAGSPQDQWLQADLAANTRPCIIAMWHQPFVSSDSWYSSSRKIFWDRLYAAGADIVLNGHLHYYERMYPQTPTLVRDTVTGIRQFIVGTGGASTYTPDTLNVNTVTVAPSRGVLKLTLGPGTYSWEFVWAKGQTYTDSGSGTCH